MDHFTNSIPFIGTLAVGTAVRIVGKAPTDTLGGGVTITEAFASSSAAIAAGSVPQYELLTLSSSYVVNGTIAAITTGAFGAGTPKAFTVSDGWVDGGEYIGIREAGTVVNADTLKVVVSYNAIMGR